MRRWIVLLSMLLTGSQSVMAAEVIKQFKQAPAGNFDIFKNVTQDAMAPAVLDDKSITSGNTSSRPNTTLPTVGLHSVGLINKSTSTMYFAAGEVQFEMAAGATKMVDLPQEMTTLTLEYSIQGQKKQLALTSGKFHSLGFDAATLQIVAR